MRACLRWRRRPGRVFYAGLVTAVSMVGCACNSSGPWLLDSMANPHDDPAALKALQDDIYRERVLRARGLTVEQRLADVFELSNHQFGMMLAGAMHRLGTRDEEAGWKEVRRWMSRLDQLHEHGLYITEPPSSQSAA